MSEPIDVTDQIAAMRRQDRADARKAFGFACFMLALVGFMVYEILSTI